MPKRPVVDTPRTLPDYFVPGLKLVLVGINPGLYSARVGHYFARRTNRFWPALSRSSLSAPIRLALGRGTLLPEDDSALLGFGIGFTDVVKRPTRNASELTPEEFREGALTLLEKLTRFRPAVACFQGVTGYGSFARHALADDNRRWDLGPQPLAVGATRLFVVPSPSPANAHFTLADQVAWYDRLADYLRGIHSR